MEFSRMWQKSCPVLQVVLEDYLQRVRKADFDVFHKSLQNRNPLLPVQLYLRSWRNTYWLQPSSSPVITVSMQPLFTAELKTRDFTVWFCLRVALWAGLSDTANKVSLSRQIPQDVLLIPAFVVGAKRTLCIYPRNYCIQKSTNKCKTCPLQA